MSEFFMRTAEVSAVKINGEKLPLVTDVCEERKKTFCNVEAFGEKEPVVTKVEKIEYRIKISLNSDKASLHNADDFELELEGEDKTVTYRNCHCVDIQRVSESGMPVKLCISVIAGSREEE